MSKSLILKDNQYWDSSAIVHNKIKLSEYIDKITACGFFKINNTLVLNKDSTYGGVQIPLDTEVFNFGNIFELKNNKVYCKVNAIVQINFNVDTYLDNGYVLFGGLNGRYISAVGATKGNSLSGVNYVGSSLIEVKGGDYLTLALGKNTTYSNISVLNTTFLSASIKRLL